MHRCTKMVEFFAKQGYWVLFVAVFGRRACVPLTKSSPRARASSPWSIRWPRVAANEGLAGTTATEISRLPSVTSTRPVLKASYKVFDNSHRSISLTLDCELTASLDQFKLARSPSFVEPRLQWAVQAQENAPTLVRAVCTQLDS